jgi:hypothetical protein
VNKRQFMDCRTCADVGYHTSEDGCLNFIEQQGEQHMSYAKETVDANAFRDAIHEAVGPYIEADCGPFQHMDIVNAILAMPEMQALRAEIERLRAAGDALAEVADEWPELVEAWKEARREQ